MYNLLRKSLIIIAGLGLLFLSGCTTISSPSVEEKESLSLQNIFPEDRDTLIYIELDENLNLINNILESFPMDSTSLDLINSSNELFLGFDENISYGFDAIVKGEYSKWKAELGLFFSFNWKKVREDDTRYWESKDGLKIYFASDNEIIISTFNIVALIESFQNSFLDNPSDSILLILPKVEDDFTKELSNGFIKGGIKNISIALDKVDVEYKLTGIIGLESERKARGFRLLIKMFLKFLISGSDDENIVKIGEELEVSSENNLVSVENVILDEIFLTNYINNLLLLEGEADK